MIDVNKTISLISILIIMAVGIGVLSGVLLQVDTKMRIGIGVLVAVYSFVRLYFLLRKPRKRSLLREESRVVDRDSDSSEKA